MSGTHGGEADEERQHKKKRQSEIAISLAGALAGGLLGYEVSKRHGKPETFHALAGAVAGGVLAREGNKFYEHHKDEVHERVAREKEKLRGDSHSERRRHERYDEEY